MLNKCICLWKKIVYTHRVAASRAYFKLSLEAEQKKNIPQAIEKLEKSLQSGKKALSLLLDDKFFPEATASREALQETLELMREHRKILYTLNISKN